jgi:malonyl-CoA O-methyltransferase
MSGLRGNPVAAAFDAARDYERYARVQSRIAARLAADIGDLALPPSPRVLELGCGTGFLTRDVAARLPDARFLVTDIAPAMLERCRARLGDRATLAFALLDADHDTPPEPGRYELVCSSLALQWSGDPAAAIRRMLGWLAPGGHLVFTSLLSGTFAEWRAAHAAEGLTPGLRRLPARDVFDATEPAARARPHRVDIFHEDHASGRAFLRALRAIGADTPDPGHRTLGPGEMRRVLRRFDAGGAGVSYEVITCHYRCET